MSKFKTPKVWLVVYNISQDPEEQDPTIAAFQTRYHAKLYYDACVKKLEQSRTKIEHYREFGRADMGNESAFTLEGPYNYVRLNGMEWGVAHPLTVE